MPTGVSECAHWGQGMPTGSLLQLSLDPYLLAYGSLGVRLHTKPGLTLISASRHGRTPGQWEEEARPGSPA